MHIERHTLPESGYAGNGATIPDATQTYDLEPLRPLVDGDVRMRVVVDLDATFRLIDSTVTKAEEARVLEKDFNRLVAIWKAETGHLSLVRQQITSLSFLKIIKLGNKVLPLLLEEFRRLPISAWVVALEVLADDNPAKDAKDYKEAVKLWLTWGENNGYIE